MPKKFGAVAIALLAALIPSATYGVPDPVPPEGTFSNGWASTTVSPGQNGPGVAAAALECWGYFSQMQRINNTLQYGGWTQCNNPHQLSLTIFLYRYIPETRTWRLVEGVDNARFAWIVNAVEAEPCTPTTKSHYYKMRTWPYMDGVQMINYGAWDDTSYVFQCRADV